MSLMMSLSTLVATRCRNNSQNAAQHYSPNQVILYHSCCLLVYVTLQIQQSSLISAQNAWTSLSHVPCPFPPFSSAQKSWDWPLLKLKFDNVMSAAHCTISSRSSSASCGCITSFWRFFERNPILICWTRLENSSFRIAKALPLGAPICAPHQCVCGENVDQYGVHGLSCRRSSFATQRRQ